MDTLLLSSSVFGLQHLQQAAAAHWLLFIQACVVKHFSDESVHF